MYIIIQTSLMPMAAIQTLGAFVLALSQGQEPRHSVPTRQMACMCIRYRGMV